MSEGNFLSCLDKNAESHGWRGILIGRDLIKRNSGWLIGNGESIHVWDDPWLSTTVGEPTASSASLKVSDLMLQGTTEWDIEKIRHVCPVYETQILRLRSSQTGAPDRLCWIGTKTGEYTTRSGYISAVSENAPAEDQQRSINWNQHVWSLKTAPKIKTFVWKALKRALPVGTRLVDRHISADPSCKRCGNPESINHLFIHCQFAQEVWRTAPFVVDCDSSGLLDLDVYWAGIATQPCLPPPGISTTHLAPWILWEIWKARNKLVFEDFTTSPIESLSRAISAAREWELGQTTHATIIATKPPATPPQIANSVLLRTDAAWWVDSLTAGLGWIILKPNDTLQFTRVVSQVHSPLMGEALAMRSALL